MAPLVELKERLDPLWRRLSLMTVLGVLLASVAVTGFVALADEVLEGETEAVDRAIMTAVSDFRTDALDVVAIQVTALGNLATLTVVALAAVAILWASRRRVSVALLLVCGSSSVLVSYLLKRFFDRPRPGVADPLAETLTASFPSGHAMGAAVVYGTVAFLVGRMAAGGVRWATWIGATVLVVLIGASRVYVGVHYPSDVAAGWLGGIAWTAVLVVLFREFGVLEAEAALVADEE